MKSTKLFLILCLLLSGLVGFSQTVPTDRVLSNKEADSVFSEKTRKELRIIYPIVKVYEYADKLGRHYLVLTESGYKSGDSWTNDTIQGFSFMVNNGQLTREWTILDFILINGNENSEENSISFWTKYASLKDLDGDGQVDPIIVYGTLGMNGTGDGRINILTFHNGAKRAIRHQNGMLDGERSTQVDSAFYKLPQPIQEQVKTVMKSMMVNDHAIFPRGWEEAMKNKELRFEE